MPDAVPTRAGNLAARCSTGAPARRSSTSRSGSPTRPTGSTARSSSTQTCSTPRTIERFSRQYARLLEDLVVHPERRLSELSLLTDAERRESCRWGLVPSQLGRTAGHRRSGLSLRASTAAFEAQVRATPDASALVAARKTLTYAELNARANRLAHHLRSRGAGPEVRVGLVLDDPINRIVAVLGVLKAGGAYVPLEPTTPRTRLEGMLDIAGVLHRDRRAGARDRSPRPWRRDRPRCRGRRHRRGEPRRSRGAGATARTSPTSSSPRAPPGGPRVCMVPHRGLLAAAAAWEHAYDLRRPPLRHLQAAGFAFDVFTGDWVRALTTGGTLVACPRPGLARPGGARRADPSRTHRVPRARPGAGRAAGRRTSSAAATDLAGVRLLAVGSDTLAAGCTAGSAARRPDGPGASTPTA